MQKIGKRGRTTLVTHGIVMDIDAFVSNGTHVFKHQIITDGISPQGWKALTSQSLFQPAPLPCPTETYPLAF